MLKFGTLSSCEANNHILINGERSILLGTKSKLGIESHFIREAFLIFKLNAKGCNLEINNVIDWIDNFTKVNGLDAGAIHLSSKIVPEFEPQRGHCKPSLEIRDGFLFYL